MTQEAVQTRAGTSLEAASPNGQAAGHQDSASPNANRPTPEQSASRRRMQLSDTEEQQAIRQLPFMVAFTAIALTAMVTGRVLQHLHAGLSLPAVVAYAVAYVFGGYYSLRAGLDSLRRRSFDVNILMILAAFGAAYLNEPFEGAILMFLFSLSNTLETFAMSRTHKSISALLDLAPKQARRINAQSGAYEEVRVDDLRIGDQELIRPGEQVPLDGRITAGGSQLDEAQITGESMPVEKHQGDLVFGGTMNGSGSLTVEVTADASNSTIARIVQIVMEARERKAKSQDFTDRIIGQYYAISVIGLTAVAFGVFTLLLNFPMDTAVYRAITLMVVASPCAVVISIPSALLSALAKSARSGVLFKGGLHLEAAAEVRAIAFDKTGTITNGKPAVVDCSDWTAPTGTGGTAGDVLRLAASVEQYSDHPIAEAVVSAAEERGIALESATDFASDSGVGVSGIVGSSEVRVLRPDRAPSLPPHRLPEVTAHEDLGHSVVIVTRDDTPIGLIAVADTIRDSAVETVARLRQQGFEHIALLTGDNERVGTAIARQVGIETVRSGLLPEEKVTAIEELRTRYGALAMVGDGVNDAPALAVSDLGIAMGAAGTDVALESAGVLLMGDDLEKLPETFDLARRSRRIIRQNLAFAFSVAAGLVITTLTVGIPLPLGVLGHEGSTVLVVANGLRLLGRTSARKPPHTTC